MDNYEKLQDFEEISLEEIIIHKEEECPICYEYLKNYITLECDHNLCLKCLNGQIEHNLFRCPLCRIEVEDIRNSMRIYERLREKNLTLSRVNLILEIENKVFRKNNIYLNYKYQKIVLMFFFILLVLILYFYGETKVDYENNNQEESKTDLQNVLKLIELSN